jgi:hypothetical protein
MFRSLFRSNSFLSASLEADEMEEDSMASFKCASDVDCDQWMNFKIKVFELLEQEYRLYYRSMSFKIRL